MKLEDIDFHELARFEHQSAWDTNNSTRCFYTDSKYFYKIWNTQYVAHKLFILSNYYRHYTFTNTCLINSLSCGLIDQDICPAFIDYIVDGSGECRGYITLKGQVLGNNSCIPKQFVEKLFANTLKSGFIFNDCKSQNIIVCDGKCSIIDLDSPPSLLKAIDLNFQKQEGFLRDGLCEYYSTLIVGYLNSNHLLES